MKRQPLYATIECVHCKTTGCHVIHPWQVQQVAKRLVLTLNFVCMHCGKAQDGKWVKQQGVYRKLVKMNVRR